MYSHAIQSANVVAADVLDDLLRPRQSNKKSDANKIFTEDEKF